MVRRHDPSLPGTGGAPTPGPAGLDQAATAPEAELPPALRELVEELAALPRAPGSPGEAEAAERFAAALTAAGAEAEVQSASFLPGYAEPIGALCGLTALAGAAALARRRPRRHRIAATLVAGAALAIADDVSNNLRPVRAIGGPAPTQNVVARIGEATAPRTLVVLAHHDAAPTGVIFNDAAQVWAARRYRGFIERVDTGLPLWWAVLGGPLLTLAGLARSSRRLIALGTAWSAIDTAVFLDIAASPTVPGANDNLSALAVQLGLALRLGTDPPPGLRVLLVSCGAEEVIQGGINSFAKRWFPELDPERTWVLNLDTVGSPELVLLEGEGALVMEDYHHRPFRDLIARVADRAGAPIRRGLRARNSTDAVIPSRAGYPTATLTSVDRAKALTNYHRMTDTPDRLHWRTIAHALLVCEEVARELAVNPWLS